MAMPRVFISSTYYDLKHVRNDIGNFIKSLGYEPVMHDKGGIAYSQTDTLENSCYNELLNCDIVVCIIGNKFGTQSSGSDYSITMEELKTAVKAKKKVYIFIAKDVYIENSTYLANKNADFKPAFADNIKIHEFIADIRNSIKNCPIMPFDTVVEILDSLKSQFAGLFQRLLAQESSVTESKTYYDIQSIADRIKDSLDEFKSIGNDFMSKFDGTLMANNFFLRELFRKIGIKEANILVTTKSGLFEMLSVCGFTYDEDQSLFDEFEYFCKNTNGKQIIIKIHESVFDNDKIKIFRNKQQVEGCFEYSEVEDDEDLPF